MNDGANVKPMDTVSNSMLFTAVLSAISELAGGLVGGSVTASGIPQCRFHYGAASRHSPEGSASISCAVSARKNLQFVDEHSIRRYTRPDARVKFGTEGGTRSGALGGA